MSRIAVLLGSFLLTFALLSVTWMVAIGPQGTAAQPTMPATAGAPTGTATPTPATTSPEVPTTAPVGSPEPSPTDTQTFAVAGSGFVESQVPDGGSITPSGDGADIQTTVSASESLWVTYRPDLTALPAGAQMVSVDTRLCGHADGQSWNIEGPPGSTPATQQNTQPETDGCWHFTDSPGEDFSVVASVMLQSSMAIDKVEYTVTFVR